MRKINKKWIPIAAVLLAILCVGIGIGGARAKYKQQVMVTGTVNYYNKLADEFVLTEPASVTASSGEQTEGTGTTQEDNYYLIPGAMIPENPYIMITGKTNLESTLFIEAIGEPASGSIDASLWEKIDGLTGPEGGDVYVYSGTFDEDAEGHIIIHILAGQEALSRIPGNLPDTDAFKVIGYLVQTADDTNSAKDLFEARILN